MSSKWTFENDELFTEREQWLIRDEGTDNRDIVALVPKTGDEECDNDVTYRNARLIAAAPELLEALKRLYGSSRSEPVGKDGKDCWLVSPKALENARLAIAKAKTAAEPWTSRDVDRPSPPHPSPLPPSGEREKD